MMTPMTKAYMINRPLTTGSRIQQQIVAGAAPQTMLHEQGARMMRPYEHWNEDERYMQYMECDRFGEGC